MIKRIGLLIWNFLKAAKAFIAAIFLIAGMFLTFGDFYFPPVNYGNPSQYLSVVNSDFNIVPEREGRCQYVEYGPPFGPDNYSQQYPTVLMPEYYQCDIVLMIEIQPNGCQVLRKRERYLEVFFGERITQWKPIAHNCVQGKTQA